MTTSADTAAILHRLNDATKPVDAADRNLIIRMLTAPTTGSAPEPVGYAWQSELDKFASGEKAWIQLWRSPEREAGEVALYAAPPANAPVASVLTDALIFNLAMEESVAGDRQGRLIFTREAILTLARDIERALLAASMGGDKA